ncbi:MAG: TRAP transporter TatT component family protein [Myxococcales bacterium]|nr:TRAP transporter TatT component family protein [Myxococcales bacterium]
MSGSRDFRTTLLLTGLVSGLISVTACDTAKFAADSTSGLFQRAAPAIEQYWDYETAGAAFPASIIQLEGIMRVVPDNEVVVMSTIGAYIGYGTGWIEDRVEVADADDAWEEAEDLRARALIMYERAWDLSKHLMRQRDESFDEALSLGPDGLQIWLDGVLTEPEDAALAFWAGASLGARINMGMEDMDTVADLPLAKVLLGHSVELDPDFLFMTPNMILGVLAASQFPPDMDLAKTIFDEVLEGTERRNLMVQLNMARHYAVNKGDSELFRELLTEVLEAGDVLPESRLSNVIAKRRAKRYMDQIEFFFSDLSE